MTAANNTFTIADTINGGAGKDNLKILTVDNSVSPAINLANVTNVENFFIRNLDNANAATLDASVVQGEEQVWNDRSTGTVTMTNLGTGTVVGVKGNGLTNIGTTNFAMATATDAVSVALDGGIKGRRLLLQLQAPLLPLQSLRLELLTL